MTHDELTIKVEWFLDVFKDVIREEGWWIFERSTKEEEWKKWAFYIVDTNNTKNDQHAEQLVNISREYGWISTGYTVGNIYTITKILDFDINKLTRNRYLITGLELGLL